MDNYIKNDFAQGKIPFELSKLTLFERSRLLDTMRQNSKLVRIIEAPALYGKSVVAYQYAHSINPDRKVCWIDAQKKLFLNSFTKRELLHKLCLTLGRVDVIVFDGLAELASQSLRVFSFLLTYLLRQDCEIIITCRVKPDLEKEGISTFLLTAADLLLSEEEIKEVKEQGFQFNSGYKEFASIPFVAFHTQRNISSFASYLIERTGQSKLELFESFLLCFKEGTKAEIAPLFKKHFMQLFNGMEEKYPHCGVQFDSASFRALPLSLFDRCRLMSNIVGELVSVSTVLSSDAFLEKVIALLIKREEFSYALLLARELLSKQQQLVIFQKYGRLCNRCGHAKEVVELVEKMGESQLTREIDLLCYAQALGDTGNADYCSLVLTRIGDLHSERDTTARLVDTRISKDFSIDVLSGFKVTRLGEPFPQGGTIRLKARVLLTLLVLNHKRELSRNWLGRVLWPDSSEEKCRQNFYNLWSYTRRLFERGKGNCPYFISTSYSIRLNEEYVDSDIINLESICDDLINKRMPSMGYAECLEWIERVCCSSLLPGADCPEITAQSKVLRNRLIDALVTASEMMFKQQNGQLGMRFIQKAFLCDSTREDTCYLLMKMLKAMGQYSKAINVFIRHKNGMIDKYGVENSKRVTLLYEEILKELS